MSGFIEDFIQMNLHPIEYQGLTTFITQSKVSDLAVEQAIQTFKTLRPRPGTTGTGVDKTKKDSLDISLPPNHCLLLQDEIMQIVSDYFAYYNLESFVPELAMIEHMNIQKYPLKGAYHLIHADRGYEDRNAFRELVWMTFLNDVHTGGETEFMFYKLKIKPEKGLTLVWPAGWTHLHRGLPSPTTEKMIATGWFTPLTVVNFIPNAFKL